MLEFRNFASCLGVYMIDVTRLTHPSLSDCLSSTRLIYQLLSNEKPLAKAIRGVRLNWCLVAQMPAID